MKTYKTILTIDNKNFCAFCGDEIICNKDGQLLCDCDDAKHFRDALHIALQLEMEANKIMRDAPKPHYELRTVCHPIPSDSDNTTSKDDEPSVCV